MKQPNLNMPDPFREAKFTDDLIFKEVLKRHPEITQEIIRRCVPDIDAGSFELIESEREIIAGVKDRRIRLDLVVEGRSGVIDMEMFTYKTDLPRTARFNASMITSQQPSGIMMKDISDVVILVFTTYDPFGGGFPIYTVQITVDPYPEYVYNKGRRIIYFTPAGVEKAPEELRGFLQLLGGKIVKEDPLVQKILEAVEEIKTDTEIRRMYMALLDKEYALREEGKEEGREQGIIEGRELGIAEGKEIMKKEIIVPNIQMLVESGISDEQIIWLLTDKMSFDSETAMRLVHDVRISGQ